MKKRIGLLTAAGLLAAVGVGFLLARDRERPPAAPAAEDQKPDDQAKAKADPKDPKRADDDKAIRKQSAELMSAIEKGDAKALAEFWTEEGEFVEDDGTTMRGRAAIEAAYAKAFAKRPKVKLDNRIDSVRFLSRDSAVEEGYVRVQKGKAEQPNSSRYSILYIREGERWRVALFREWPEAGLALRDLEWLVGSWTAKGEDYEVRTVYEWDEGRKFLRGRITIKEPDRTVTATQVICRDPRGGALRSWLFESDGGFGEAEWSWDGKRWVIDANGVQADGDEMEATNILTPLDKDSFTWQSIDRTVNGEEVPNLPPVKVVRAK
jgi:uncharacterized protein (TIGR02246 family)